MTRSAVDLAEKTARSIAARLTAGGLFYDHMPMLNSCAARFRFSREDFPLCMRRRRDREKEEDSPRKFGCHATK